MQRPAPYLTQTALPFLPGTVILRPGKWQFYGEKRGRPGENIKIGARDAKSAFLTPNQCSRLRIGAFYSESVPGTPIQSF